MQEKSIELLNRAVAGKLSSVHLACRLSGCNVS